MSTLFHKRSHFRNIIIALFLCLFLIGSVEASRPRAYQRPSGPIRLLVTHPKAGYLEALITLVQGKHLNAPHLELIGVYHEDEYSDFTKAKKLLASRPEASFIRLEVIRGSLKPTDLWQRNRLSSTFRRLFSKVDGIIFTGGPDIPPWLYGRKTNLLTVVRNPPRHFWELSFLAHLLGTSRNPKLVPLLAKRPDFPLLGICLGMQSLNVATGGSLIQDIPSEIYGCKNVEDVLALPTESQHRNYCRALTNHPSLDSGCVHPIRLIAPWPFAPQISKLDHPLVASVHHQCIDSLGQDLQVIARSMDGKVIEAVRHKSFRNVLGVQFHPERSQVFALSKKRSSRKQRSRSRHSKMRRSTVNGPTTASFFAKHPPSQRFTADLWIWMGEWLSRSRHARALSKRNRRRRRRRNSR